jgi:hypothetical protein
MSSDRSSHETLAAARICVPDHVVYRSFGNETVLLNLETGQYHGLNQSAGRMLEVLDQTGSGSATAELIADEFDQPVEVISGDLARLCEGLIERGLIEVDVPSS